MRWCCCTYRDEEMKEQRFSVLRKKIPHKNDTLALVCPVCLPRESNYSLAVPKNRITTSTASLFLMEAVML